MVYDYNRLYETTPNALGLPAPVIISFFQDFALKKARVLDVGCGQGRDAVFIAKMGHNVVGVDISPKGIHDLNRIAIEENLAMEGIVADISIFTPEGVFDIILIDRTLHMLPRARRFDTLRRLLGCTQNASQVLIADERSNMSEFRQILMDHCYQWSIEINHNGYLFARRDDR